MVCATTTTARTKKDVRDDQSYSSNSTTTIKSRLQALLKKPENQSCCDCSNPGPTWASLIVPPPASLLVIPSAQQQKQHFPTIGVFCCYQCAGLHRSLGTHICRVKSCHLDKWSEAELLAMERSNNNRTVNAIWEATLHYEIAKPTARSETSSKIEFVRDKYQRRCYLDASQYTQLCSFSSSSSEEEKNSNRSNGRCNGEDNDGVGGNKTTTSNHDTSTKQKLQRNEHTTKAKIKTKKASTKTAKNGDDDSSTNATVVSTTDDNTTTSNDSSNFTDQINRRESYTYDDLFRSKHHIIRNSAYADRNDAEYYDPSDNDTDQQRSEMTISRNLAWSFHSRESEEEEEVDDDEEEDNNVSRKEQKRKQPKKSKRKSSTKKIEMTLTDLFKDSDTTTSELFEECNATYINSRSHMDTTATTTLTATTTTNTTKNRKQGKNKNQSCLTQNPQQSRGENHNERKKQRNQHITTTSPQNTRESNSTKHSKKKTPSLVSHCQTSKATKPSKIKMDSITKRLMNGNTTITSSNNMENLFHASRLRHPNKEEIPDNTATTTKRTTKKSKDVSKTCEESRKMKSKETTTRNSVSSNSRTSSTSGRLSSSSPSSRRRKIRPSATKMDQLIHELNNSINIENSSCQIVDGGEKEPLLLPQHQKGKIQKTATIRKTRLSSNSVTIPSRLQKSKASQMNKNKLLLDQSLGKLSNNETNHLNHDSMAVLVQTDNKQSSDSSLLLSQHSRRQNHHHQQQQQNDPKSTSIDKKCKGMLHSKLAVVDRLSNTHCHNQPNDTKSAFDGYSHSKRSSARSVQSAPAAAPEGHVVILDEFGFQAKTSINDVVTGRKKKWKSTFKSTSTTSSANDSVKYSDDNESTSIGWSLMEQQQRKGQRRPMAKRHALLADESIADGTTTITTTTTMFTPAEKTITSIDSHERMAKKPIIIEIRAKSTRRKKATVQELEPSSSLPSTKELKPLQSQHGHEQEYGQEQTDRRKQKQDHKQQQFEQQQQQQQQEDHELRKKQTHLDTTASDRHKQKQDQRLRSRSKGASQERRRSRSSDINDTFSSSLPSLSVTKMHNDDSSTSFTTEKSSAPSTSKNSVIRNRNVDERRSISSSPHRHRSRAIDDDILPDKKRERSSTQIPINSSVEGSETGGHLSHRHHHRSRSHGRSRHSKKSRDDRTNSSASTGKETGLSSISSSRSSNIIQPSSSPTSRQTPSHHRKKDDSLIMAMAPPSPKTFIGIKAEEEKLEKNLNDDTSRSSQCYSLASSLRAEGAKRRMKTKRRQQQQQQQDQQQQDQQQQLQTSVLNATRPIDILEVPSLMQLRRNVHDSLVLPTSDTELKQQREPSHEYIVEQRKHIKTRKNLNSSRERVRQQQQQLQKQIQLQQEKLELQKLQQQEQEQQEECHHEQPMLLPSTPITE